MHVAQLRIAGVRGFHGDKSVDLDFTRPDGSLAGWTVLAGRNGSGKSTVLQALALALAGPRSTSFIPSLADWMSRGSATAEVRATLRMSGLPDWGADDDENSLDVGIPGEVWITFERQLGSQDANPQLELMPAEPRVRGLGIDSLVDSGGLSEITPRTAGGLYVGYGPFRHLGSATSRSRRSPGFNPAPPVALLFDETIPLTDAIDWLVELHLLQLEGRLWADHVLDMTMALLGDGLLPDGFQVRRVTSEGLWVGRDDTEFPLREMSDGFRAVTALVVDILRRMASIYSELILIEHDGVPTIPYPGVVLIDEIDAHLHVNWQQKIGTWLKSHFPEIQFIVTTHSPYICQSADPGGLILLPGPGDDRPPYVVSDDVYERIIYGSGDDVVLTELFGVKAPYSEKATGLRQVLADLEEKVFGGTASPAEKEEYRRISDLLTSSASARVDEIAVRFRRDQ
jgi:hypothetical protein